LTPDQWENLRININPAFSILSFNYDIDAVWQAVHKKQDPEVPQKVPQQIIVYRRDHEVYHQKIAPHQSHLLTALKSDSSFLKACQTCAPHSFTDEKVMEEVMASLAFICQLGLVCSAEST
jgi:hypothetical protein